MTPDPRKAADRTFCFLVMLALGHTERTTIERAIEIYADGAGAAVSDYQRGKRIERECFRRCYGITKTGESNE